MKRGEWVKSSFCSSSECVTVRLNWDHSISVWVDGDVVPPAVVSREEWEAFIKGVKAGEFDL